MELLRISLSTAQIVADDVPYVSGVLTLPPDTWADLTPRGYPGVGYWPVTDQVPTYDPKTQVLGAESLTVDAANQRVIRTWAVNPAPVVVPEIISPRQFRQSLTHFGFRPNVETAIGAADQDTKDWYQFATQFERNHPKVLAMAQAMGYTSVQIDQVWTYGATL